jgi:hypothetical protein
MTQPRLQLPSPHQQPAQGVLDRGILRRQATSPLRIFERLLVSLPRQNVREIVQQLRIVGLRFEQGVIPGPRRRQVSHTQVPLGQGPHAARLPVLLTTIPGRSGPRVPCEISRYRNASSESD